MSNIFKNKPKKRKTLVPDILNRNTDTGRSFEENVSNVVKISGLVTLVGTTILKTIDAFSNNNKD